MSEVIFFAINSANDSDLINTLESLLFRINKERNFSIGIITHDDPEKPSIKRSDLNKLAKYFEASDNNDSTHMIKFENMHYLVESSYGGKIKFISIEQNSSNGFAWGRGLCEMLAPAKFDFYFQLSSSMRFRDNFDSNLISMLIDTPTYPMSILTTTPPSFLKDSGSKSFGSDLRPTLMIMDCFDYQTCLPLCSSRLLNPPIETPPQCRALVNPDFLVVPFSVLDFKMSPFEFKEVLPPGMEDSEEEIEEKPRQLLLNWPLNDIWENEDDVVLAARFFTHGITAYCPSESCVYARKSNHSLPQYDDSVNYEVSLSLIRSLVGIPHPPHAPIKNLPSTDTHGTTSLLGMDRSIEDFWSDWLGCDVKAQEISEVALKGFIGVKGDEEDAFVDLGEESKVLGDFLKLAFEKMKEEQTW